MEDISYAAAFELGRLLAAADPRLGQELMRWRRESYRQSARSSVAASVWSEVPQMVTDAPDALRQGMVAPVSVTVLERAGSGAGDAADTTGLQAAGGAPGFDPARLASAWQVTAKEAAALLSGHGSQEGAIGEPPGPVQARERIAATAARHAEEPS